MTIRGFLKSLTSTSAAKAPGALNSRKFMVMCAVAGIVVGVCYILVAAIGVTESGIVEKCLDVLQNTAIAYFSVNVAEKAVDAYKARNQSNGGEV